MSNSLKRYIFRTHPDTYSGSIRTAFFEAITDRLAKFGLELSEEKNKIIRFGRFAKEKNTFDFLGFTFINGKRRKDGKYAIILRIRLFLFEKRQNAIASSTVYKNFRKMLWKSGISHGGKGRGPRLHDFRHTFAVHSLNQLVRQGVDLCCALPILSTYLGHASVAATERYLRLTEEA